MKHDDHRWAVILPTSDGGRPPSLEDHRRVTRKQYCAFNGGEALIRTAIRRAQTVVAQDRICILVEREDGRYWWPLRSLIPAANLLVQPRDRGTATGVLFGVLKILDRDPFAQVLFIPADHHFLNEAAVTFAMNGAFDRLANTGLELALIAVGAEHPAVDRVYVVPGARLQHDLYKVKGFINSPDPHLAQSLFENGSLWSISLFCAWGFAVLALLRQHMPDSVDGMSSALARTDLPSHSRDALAELFERLPTMEFSGTVLQKSRSMMQVIHAHCCGWSDLGGSQQLQLCGGTPSHSQLLLRLQ